MSPSFSCLALSAPPEPSLHSLVFRLTLGVGVIFTPTPTIVVDKVP